MRIRWTLTVLLLIAALPASGCAREKAAPPAADCGSSRATNRTPALTTPTPIPPNQGELNEIASAVRALGESSYSEVFAGIEVDTAGDWVRVFRKPSERFDRAVANISGSDRVVFECARYSAAALQPIFDVVRGDYEYWKQQGLTLHLIGVRHTGECVEVGTTDPARAAREVHARYPSYPLCFIESGPRTPFGDGSL